MRERLIVGVPKNLRPRLLYMQFRKFRKNTGGEDTERGDLIL